MRFAAVLPAVVGALAIMLAVSVQAEENEPRPAAESEATLQPAPAPLTQRAVVPGLAAGWTPEQCSTNVSDPCLLPIALVAVSSANGGQAVTLTVEIANRPDQRRRGLMFRESLAELAGMFFVFPGERSGGFWMKNTLIPLDIAYLDEDGTVLAIVHGAPRSLDVLTPSQPYRYTLEVNGGWFERQGFGVGDSVAIPAGVEAER